MGRSDIRRRLGVDLLQVQEPLQLFGEPSGLQQLNAANAPPPRAWRFQTHADGAAGPQEMVRPRRHHLRGKKSSHKVTGEGASRGRLSAAHAGVSSGLFLVTSGFGHFRNGRTDERRHLLWKLFCNSPHFHFHWQKQHGFVCPRSASCCQPRFPYAAGGLLRTSRNL